MPVGVMTTMQSASNAQAMFLEARGEGPPCRGRSASPSIHNRPKQRPFCWPALYEAPLKTSTTKPLTEAGQDAMQHGT